MKFTASFSALLVVVSFAANAAALAVPEEALVARAGFRGGQGGKGKGTGAANNAGAGTAATTTAAAAAATTTAAAASGNNAAASGNNAGATDAQGLQSSTQLDSSVIQTTDNGQNPPVTGQSAAAVSTNNFINFCALGLPNVPITNGLQTTTGSCNPTPIGNIPSSDNMPSGKFQSPTNGDTIQANTPFTVTLGVKNIQLGTFTNAQKTYFANPQTLNGAGQIIGHTHIVIEAIDSLSSTTITDPTKFTFFKGVDDAQNGQGTVSVNVTAGVPAGAYRMGTIMSSATHQPCIVPIAQHGLLDDVVYFTASANGAAAAGNNAGAGAAAAGNAGTAAAGNAGAAAAGAAAGAATGKGKGGKGAAAAAGAAAASTTAAAAAGGAAAAAASTTAAAAAGGAAATTAAAATATTATAATGKGAGAAAAKGAAGAAAAKGAAGTAAAKGAAGATAAKGAAGGAAAAKGAGKSRQ